MIFVATFSLAALAAAQTNWCFSYVCDPHGVHWYSGECAKTKSSNSSQIYLKTGACKSSQVCPVESLQNAYNSNAECEGSYNPEPSPTAYPGERCDRMNSCVNGDCFNGFCLTTTHPCNNVYDCGLGKHCSGGKCLSQVAIGGICNYDTDCVNNAGCDAAWDGFSSEGICVQYGSVAAGKSVHNCEGSTTTLAPHPLCASGFCYETATAGSYSCSGPLVSPSIPPIRCMTEPFCTSDIDKTSGLNYTQECGCGYDGYFYCPLFPGDAEYLNYTNDLQAYMSSPNLTHCSTARHPSQGYSLQASNYFWCAQQVLTSLEEYHYLRATMYPQVVMASDCVLEVLVPTYYNADPGLDSLSLKGISLYGLYLILIE